MTNKTRVLYVEDNPADKDLTQMHFRGHAPEFELDVASTGQSCLDRLEATSYDVLLLDNHLPDMSGIDVLKQLATRDVLLPVVLVTAVGDEALVVQALRLGASDYIPKQGNYIENLPVVLKNAITDYRTAHQPRRVGRQHERILYVERHAADIEFTLEYLGGVAPHFRVDVVHTAAEALTRLQSEEVDLVLSDLRMPDMNALDLLRDVKLRGILVPFIILTGRGDETMATAALKLGAYDYIVKRDNYLTQLPYAIDNALSRFRLARELEERQRLQASAEEALALLDTLQRHAPIGIAFLDTDCRFLRMNDELALIIGVSAAESLGRTVAEIVPELWPQLEPLHGRVLAGEPVLKVEISGKTSARPGVERQWVASYYPICRLNQDVVGVGVFVTEVTESKRAETALREYAAALSEGARQKDEFLAMLGHELRNPLAPIRTALEVLRRSPDVDVQSEVHDVMDRQITYMGRLLDDLLDVSRITSGRITLNMQLVDIRWVVAEAIDSTRALIQARRHTLEASVPPEPLLVRGDAMRLVQVLVNLLNNAAKYTDEHGTIRILADAEDNAVVLRVADTGTGIPSRLLPKIFDLFTQDDRTLDRAQGGLGLGLTIVRKITELHGGSVEAHSEGRGHGSEFIVRLPMEAPAAVAITPETNDARRPSRRLMRCLVVEDNVDAANMLKVALELEGHAVRLSFDGRDAIDAAVAFRPDAVLLDIGLPRMNGYEVARALRQLPDFANVVIIATTGYGQETDRQRSREAGIDQYLVKPIELDALLHALDAGRTQGSAIG